MAKTRVTYVCSSCSRTAVKYMGKCPTCGEWDTFVEQIEEAPASSRLTATAGSRTEPQRLSDITGDPYERYVLPVEEFSRVLGGGIVPGSLILIGGEPGIGKSTLLLQIAAIIADSIGTVLYVSGEESVRQIIMRAKRLDITTDNLLLVTETGMESVLRHVRAVNPVVMIIDSIQTMYGEDVDSAPGNVTQVKHCASVFQALAKETGIAIFLVGHVTKEGSIAGPRVLEHIVDTVLYMEGDSFQAFRLLRCVKNRFGATSEVGVFEMGDTGLREVLNPSEAFLAERVMNAAGSAIAVSMEGTRPLLAEVQALATPTSYSNPRRTANGIDFNRLMLVAAVLTRRAGIRLYEQDIFVNIIGGLRVDEPAIDLPLAISIASSVRDIPVPADLVLIGEIGLSGEIRAVSQLPQRLKEAAKLGFKRAVIPRTVRADTSSLPEKITLIRARSLTEAISAALGD